MRHVRGSRQPVYRTREEDQEHEHVRFSVKRKHSAFTLFCIGWTALTVPALAMSWLPMPQEKYAARIWVENNVLAQLDTAGLGRLSSTGKQMVDFILTKVDDVDNSPP